MAELIGWIATAFRASGMLCENVDLVKVLISIGNLCWLTNGVMTKNRPLIASNGICVGVMLFDMIKNL